MTSYGTLGHQAPMKAFIQERLSSLILLTEEFKSISLDNSMSAPHLKEMYLDSPSTKPKLLALNTLKTEYVASGDPFFLEAFFKLRQTLPTGFKTVWTSGLAHGSET